MANLSEYQISNLSFSYLCGQDLLQFCSAQLLINQYAKNPLSLQTGCSQAYGQIEAALKNRYNIALELQKIAFTNAFATAATNGDGITGATIVYPGTNYGSSPDILFGAPGVNAAATGTVTDGVLTGIAITAPGTGYTTAPAMSITGGAAPDTRPAYLVMITAIIAIANALGNNANESDRMTSQWKWANDQLLDIRNGQSNLPLNPPANQGTNPAYNNASRSQLVCSNWRTLG